MYPTDLSGLKMSSAETFTREQIFQQMFGKMEGLKDEDYACALEDPVLRHGRMYLTKTTICFYSNLMGIEKKLKLPYEFVVRVDKIMTALVIPNAIAVVTGEKTYYFRTFLERDKCYRQLSHCIAVYRGEIADTPDAVAAGDSKPNLGARAAALPQNALNAVQNTGRAFSAGLNNFVSVFNVHGKQPEAAPAEPTEPTTEEGDGDGEHYDDDEDYENEK